MGDWKDKGSADNIIGMFLPPKYKHVENVKTGEKGIVYVSGDETVGEAVEKGHWVEPPSNSDEDEPENDER